MDIEHKNEHGQSTKITSIILKQKDYFHLKSTWERRNVIFRVLDTKILCGFLSQVLSSVRKAAIILCGDESLHLKLISGQPALISASKLAQRLASQMG